MPVMRRIPYVARRTYGQMCGLAHALEIVGERWALLIVRDLLVGPKRFTDLRNGLPKIPTNILSARLKELEQAGVIHRRLLPRPATTAVYELTEYGNELEDIVLRLGRWGAQCLGDPGPDEIITPDSLIMALRSTFRPEAARGQTATYELRTGDFFVNVSIDDGKLTVAPGELPGADLVIVNGPGMKALMAGEVSPADAVASGEVEVSGDAERLAGFVAAFGG